MFLLVEKGNRAFHQVNVKGQREKRLPENGLAEKVHDHVEALDLGAERREKGNLVQVFYNQVIFLLVLAGVKECGIVEKELAADSNGTHAVYHFFVRKTRHLVGKHRYVVAIAVDTLEKFMKIQLGTARFRVLDVSPINE